MSQCIYKVVEAGGELPRQCAVCGFGPCREWTGNPKASNIDKRPRPMPQSTGRRPPSRPSSLSHDFLYGGGMTDSDWASMCNFGEGDRD